MMATVLLFCLVSPQQYIQAETKPFLHPVFANNMVLQRDVENTIWGWTSSGEKITVKIGDKIASCVADSTGKWTATLEPFSAGGPYQMTVTGSQTVTVSDIYFGELWLCSGQSNMVMQLPFVENGDTEVQNCNNPNIRYFTTPYASSSSPQDNFGYVSGWYKCTPTSVGNLSGAAYFFAKELNEELDVPIGIICSAVGGSFIESWISNEAMETFLDTTTGLSYTPSSPDIYYNGMIAPLTPLKFKGVFWYQGESNTNFPTLYESQLTSMINDWRTNFKKADMPFVVVQLPYYTELQTTPVENVPWPVIRESQLNVSRKLNNVGLVTTMDLGAVDIHPKNKQDLGYRSALCALSKFYNKDIVPTGPLYSGMSISGNKVKITFENAQNGLMVASKTGLEPVQEVPGGTLKGFAIAGQDGNYVFADAVIDGNSVVVSSSAISNPVSVKYSWGNNPLGNLYNKDGLPASPFSTTGTVIPSTTSTPKPTLTTSTPTPTQANVIVGDLNGDGSVNSIDFGYFRMFLLGTIIDFPVLDDLKAADLNGDGSINSIDFGYLRLYLLGSIKVFPAY